MPHASIAERAQPIRQGGEHFTWKTNRLGYRGRDCEEVKPPGILRLQVYGDSMIFGSGVDEGETLPDQIEAEAVRRYGWGRWLINTWQVGTMDLFSRRRAVAELRERMEVLVGDQKERGTRIVLFSYFEEPEGVGELVPQGLKVTKLWAGLTMDEYSDWAIPDDGHPTAAGQAHFAEWLVEELLPDLGTTR